MIINNKQINIWRGDSDPPTLFHLWIYNDLELRLYNGTEWVTFIDNADLAQQIIAITEKVNLLNSKVSVIDEAFNNSTVNHKFIKDNPVLNTDDINNTQSGNFITTNNITSNLSKIDTLLDTQILE